MPNLGECFTRCDPSLVVDLCIKMVVLEATRLRGRNGVAARA